MKLVPQGLFNRIVLAILLVLGLSGPAVAQAPIPSVIEDLKLVSEDAEQAAFMLRFSPEVPRMEPQNAIPGAPALVLRTTLKVQKIPSRAAYKGLVRATLFETRGADLVMRFETAGPAKVTVEPAAGGVIQVRVRKVSDEEATGSRPLGSSGETVVPASALAPAPVAPRPGEKSEMIPLKYADVSEVIGLLVEGAVVEPNNTFIRREPGFGSLGSNGQQNYMQAANPNQRADKPLGQSFGNGLAIDRRLNAVWVTGTPERIEQVKEQIALIDVPVDSVILETQFVELTESGAKNLGIDLNNSSGQLAVGRIQTGEFLPFNVDPNDVLPSGMMQAAIYAQVEKGEGRILSRPRIAAQSGSTAKIITGDALPILTSITLSGVNGVSQQVQYVNVGVTLQIAPRVSADGFVTSQIYGVVSSVTGYSQGYPTISQREAETSASVRDGETFVIGGLAQENILKRKSKVPLLGDIPLAGQLFRLERSTSSKTELYIVITPHIVRHRRFEEGSSGAAQASAVGAVPAP